MQTFFPDESKNLISELEVAKQKLNDLRATRDVALEQFHLAKLTVCVAERKACINLLETFFANQESLLLAKIEALIVKLKNEGQANDNQSYKFY